jgi:hypothetical protein
MMPQALGPGGVAQRMQEIRSKMDAFFGNDDADSFKNALASAGGQPVSQISGGIGGLGSNTPLGIDGLTMVPEGAAPLKDMAVAAAKRYGIDPDLYVALINKESSFNPAARSDKGALGLAQLMPTAASDLGVKDRLDPAQSLDGGAKYFSQLMDRFGTPELALAAYNAGPTAVEQAGGIPNRPETQNYVSSIMKALSKRSSP